jgi:iron-sulfur cluster repair protein YtfE (RIC family)
LSSPLDAVRSLHNAFRTDILQIDNLALKIARDGGDFTAVFDRLHLIGEILDYHAQGEEAAVFPAVDNLAPLVARAYFLDHRELDIMVDGLESIRNMPDPLATARATAVLGSHLRIHLNKEDAHLYPILRERTSIPEQAAIAGQMSRKVPADKFPTLIQWLFPLLNLEDQTVITKVWMTAMPPQVFEGVKPLIQKAIPNSWVELTQKIPQLLQK